MYSLKKVLSTLDNIRIELKQSIGYTGSKGRLRKDLPHMKFTYTRCGVNQKVLMERQDVVLNRIRYLRLVRELRETGYTVAYTDETNVHTSHVVPKCWQDSTTGQKIPFSKGNLRIMELHDPWVYTLITFLVLEVMQSITAKHWPDCRTSRLIIGRVTSGGMRCLNLWL